MLQPASFDLSPDTLIRVPDAPLQTASVDLPVPARRAWSVVGDFAGFNQFITGLERIEMTGEGVRSLRKKSFSDGNIVVEQLNTHDDKSMTMTWSLIYTTFDIGNLWAAMRVVPRGNQECTVTWDIVGEPWTRSPDAHRNFVSFIDGFLEMAMANLRALFRNQN